MDRRIQLLAVTAVILLTSTMPARAADVPYVSGGIGFEGREEMQAAERDHNLKIVAAEKNGDYLAEVNVTIESAKKERMLDATMDGPILLAKLPPGTYTVRATFDGNTQSRTVSVGAGLRSVDFRWATVEGRGETALPRPPAQR
jgi:hypothetical protein